MTERPANLNRRPEISPFAAAERREDEAMARKVEEITAAIAEFAQEDIRVAVYMKPYNGVGSWTWCDDATLPIDMPVVMAEMKERFGAGNYEMRVSAKGKLRGNLPFAIAKERGDLAGASRSASSAPAAQPSMMDMLTFMMAQQAEARRESEAAASRNVALMTAAVTAIGPALVGALGGSKNNAADTIALVSALQANKPEGTSLKDMVETLVMLKGLTDAGGPAGEGASGGGLDLAEILQDGGRLVGPAVKALADLVQQRRGALALPGS